jgi:hypothetical protein
MEPNTSLYIPVNIKTRFEFFDGYGVTELIPTIVTTLASGFIALIVHTATNSAIIPVLIVLVTIATSVTVLSKGDNNMSVIDQTRCVLRFSREQKKYPYYYTDEWGI